MDQVYGRGACEITEYAFYRRVSRQTLYEIMCSRGNYLRFSSCYDTFFESFIKIITLVFMLKWDSYYFLSNNTGNVKCIIAFINCAYLEFLYKNN